MPYHIERNEADEYCVIKDTDGQSMGCHPTREEAEDQMAALYANEADKSDTAEVRFKCVPFAVKAASDDGTFEGLCSVFGNVDAYSEIVDPGAFDQDLAAFLKDGFVGGLNHDWDHPIGKPVAAKTQDGGLWVKGKISDTPHGRECRMLMKDGVVKKLSIGFRPLARREMENIDECVAYWQDIGYTPSADDMARAMRGATVLTRIKLVEFSPVTMPANEMAIISNVKAIEDRTGRRAIRALEEYLREAGGLSHTESKALIGLSKVVSALLRDAASEPAAETDAKQEPATVETTETTPAGEMPAETAEPDALPPDTEPAPVTVPQSDPLPPAEVFADEPLSALALSNLARRQQLAADAWQDFMRLCSQQGASTGAN